MNDDDEDFEPVTPDDFIAGYFAYLRAADAISMAFGALLMVVRQGSKVDEALLDKLGAGVIEHTRTVGWPDASETNVDQARELAVRITRAKLAKARVKRV